MTLLGVIVFSIVGIILAVLYIPAVGSADSIIIAALIIVAFNVIMWKISKLEEALKGLKNPNDKNNE